MFLPQICSNIFFHRASRWRIGSSPRFRNLRDRRFWSSTWPRCPRFESAPPSWRPRSSASTTSSIMQVGKIGFRFIFAEKYFYDSFFGRQIRDVWKMSKIWVGKVENKPESESKSFKAEGLTNSSLITKTNLGSCSSTQWVRFPPGAGLFFLLFLSLSSVSLIRYLKEVQHFWFSIRKNMEILRFGKEVWYHSRDG